MNDSTVNTSVFRQTIRDMLVRPEMHAQSKESLEDQFVLMLLFLGGEELQCRYSEFCRMKHSGGSYAHGSLCETMVEMANFIKEFCDLHGVLESTMVVSTVEIPKEELNSLTKEEFEATVWDSKAEMLKNLMKLKK